MRFYLIDDIDNKQMETFKIVLRKKGFSEPIEDIFHLPLPQKILNNEQKKHSECGEHYLALEIGTNEVRLELLVRAASRLHCSCIGFADSQQREYMQNMLDELLENTDTKNQ